MKKVLLVSGTPIRTDTNIGKTLQTLFADMDKTELAQLYFSPESPNVDICDSYYQICEKQMVKSIFGLVHTCGKITTPVKKGVAMIKPETNARVFTKYKNSVLMRIAREVLWNLSYWKNGTLKSWLQEVKPNVVFSIMQDTNGATRAVMWIAEMLKIPVILYITDDYYHDQKLKSNIIRKMYYKNRQRWNQRLAKHVTTLIGCSKKATDYFKDTLNIPGGGRNSIYPISRYLSNNAI